MSPVPAGVARPVFHWALLCRLVPLVCALKALLLIPLTLVPAAVLAYLLQLYYLLHLPLQVIHPCL